MPEHKNGKKNIGTSIFFSFMKLCSKSASRNRIPVVSIAVVFFEKAAIIIAIHGQKILH